MAQHEARVRQLAAEVGATAVVVCDRREVLLTVGDPAALVHTRSIRKSLLGALFGRPVTDGTISLGATLADLGIDDSVPPGLTARERSARVRDLLTCCSGIYHPSNHQGTEAREGLPPRGSHPPGTHFLYNNWDFNALGTIVERAVGRSMFDEFAEVIAGPAGLADYDPARQGYLSEPWSEHRTYAFHVSARDLARIGQVYLNPGTWRGRLVIPAAWAAASTSPHVATGRGPGGGGPAYGYLWWVAMGGQLFAGARMPDGSFAAYGMGSQFLLVIPALGRVIALLADPRRPGGTDRARHRAPLARLVHHATGGLIPVTGSP